MATNNDLFNNALATLDSLNKENATEMWIPSLARVVKFKPLTAANQKDMISTLAGSRYFPSALAITTHDVVKDTCMDDTVSIASLSSIDKMALVLQIRAANIRDQVPLKLEEQVQNNCDVLNDGLKFEKTISIKEWVKQLKTKIFDTTHQVINEDKVTVEVMMPTLASELKFQQQIYNVSRNIGEGKQQFTTEQILGQVFINTIAQYINKITVSDITIEFEQASVEQCLKLTSLIRGTLLKKVGEAINQFESMIKELTVVPFTFKDNGFVGTIVVDNSLFEV